MQLQRADLADLIEHAVSAALDDGYRTRDLIAAPNCKVVGTHGMGDAVIERLQG
jgi:3-isopropylmalate dehydrogenase